MSEHDKMFYAAIGFLLILLSLTILFAFQCKYKTDNKIEKCISEGNDLTRQFDTKAEYGRHLRGEITNY